MRNKHQNIEEPCDGKLSSTVLKTSGVGDNLAEFNRQLARILPTPNQRLWCGAAAAKAQTANPQNNNKS
jgi:hypothetical protein